MKASRSLVAIFILMATHAHAQSNPFFNILDYGAHKDGSAASTDAFRAAIEAATKSGGGTVYVPAGNYFSGPIELASNLVLHLEAGATLRFPAQRLPFTLGRVQGIECLAPVPLIGGRNLKNVAIIGRGTITTDNSEWVNLMGRVQAATAGGRGSAFGAPWDHLRELLQQKTPQPEEEYLKAAPLLRPDLIRFMDSTDVLVEGVHIAGSSFWTIHLLYCQNAVVRNVTQETFPGIFTGGIYIDSSRDVRISDCNLDNGDDAITLKAGKDADGLRVNRPTENVVITNCIIHRGSGGIVIGSETSGCIRHIVASNIICKGTQMGINIKSERGRGGVVEDVRIDNITMEDVGKAINISQFYTMQGETPAPQDPVTARTPTFRDIVISHVTVTRARGIVDFSWNPISTTNSAAEKPIPTLVNIEGLPEMPITGLRLIDVLATGKGGLRASRADGLELRDVQINSETGPAFLIRDCKELELNAASSRKPLTIAPVIRLERCSGAVIRGSRASEETGAFLSVPPGQLKEITLENNALGNARQPAIEEQREFE
jgi:polygalacturonase